MNTSPARSAVTAGIDVVTGAAGFIGAHLAARLAARGRDVRAVDVRPRPALLDRSVDYAALDFRDLGARLVGVDTVYHLASVHLEVRASASAFEATNVHGVATLLEQCAAAGVRRVVHTSSVGVYGHVTDPPASERSPTRPVSAYERSKLAGEGVAKRRAAELGLELVVLRPAWVYGPGCPRTRKLLRAIRKRRFVYIGGGTNLRHPIYIDDLIEGYVKAAETPTISGDGYILAGPRAVRLHELVDACARALDAPAPRLRLPVAAGRAAGLMAELVFGALGRDAPFSRRSLAFFENDNAFDTSAARRDLGFEPGIDLGEGLRRTIASDWWREASA